MLTVYKSSGSDGSESDKEKKKVKAGIPAYAQTVKKIHGKPHFVRYKQDKPLATGVGIMGELFGVPPPKRKAKEKEKRSKSIGALPTIHMIGGTPVLYPPGVHPEQAYLAYHQNFRPMVLPPNYQQLPMGSVSHPPNPTPADFSNLQDFTKHYKVIQNPTTESKGAKESKEEKPPKTNRTGHYCNHCGKPRSKRYHIQHPLVLDQVSNTGFCRRCQSDASSTSDSSSSKHSRKVKDKKYKHKHKSARKKVHVRFEGHSPDGSQGKSTKKGHKYNSDPESHVRRQKSKHKKERYEPSEHSSDEESFEEEERGRQGRRPPKHRYEHEYEYFSSHPQQRSQPMERYRTHERQFSPGDVVDDALRMAGPRTSSPLTRSIKVTDTKIRRPLAQHRPDFRYVEPHDTHSGHHQGRLDRPTEYIEERKAELSEFPWVSQARRPDEDEYLSPIDTTPPRNRVSQPENYHLRESERRNMERGSGNVRRAQGWTQEEIDAELFRRRGPEDTYRQEFTQEEAAQHYRDNWNRDPNYSNETSPAPQQRAPRRNNRADMDGYQVDPYVSYRHVEPRGPPRTPRAPSPPAPAASSSLSPTPAPKQVVAVVLPTINVQDCDPGGYRGEKRWPPNPSNPSNPSNPPYPVTPEGEQSNRYDYVHERPEHGARRRHVNVSRQSSREQMAQAHDHQEQRHHSRHTSREQKYYQQEQQHPSRSPSPREQMARQHGYTNSPPGHDRGRREPGWAMVREPRDRSVGPTRERGRRYHNGEAGAGMRSSSVPVHDDGSRISPWSSLDYLGRV